MKIHTPLPITAHVAKQKVNLQLALHCGQSYALGEPELQLGDRVCWRIPIWVSHPEKGRVACIGDLSVDAQTGEVICTAERMRLLKAGAEGVLRSLRSEP
ncbi:MAG: hypothetical protein HY721_00690 [Planctomycetes bacterium]|nr:hypothetical protein [Planctomycetota bacterium]